MDFSHHNELAKMCEAHTHLLLERAKGVVKNGDWMAILYSYGSAEHPLLTWTHVISSHGGDKVLRKAKEAEEPLVQVGLIKTTAVNILYYMGYIIIWAIITAFYVDKSIKNKVTVNNS